MLKYLESDNSSILVISFIIRNLTNYRRKELFSKSEAIANDPANDFNKLFYLKANSTNIGFQSKKPAKNEYIHKSNSYTEILEKNISCITVDS